ncbi:MAG TPA: EAL domain-containing protein, partial [Candidatus Baltobacteraceae bacterium]|nr:EAL domain-containing protein [Candidatus Baltobacteraceae bacterium]
VRSCEPESEEAVFSFHRVLQRLDRDLPELVIQTLAEAALAVGADLGALLQCGQLGESVIAYSTDPSLLGKRVPWSPSSPEGVQHQSFALLKAMGAQNSVCTVFNLDCRPWAIVLCERAHGLNRSAFFQIQKQLVETMTALLARRDSAAPAAHMDHVTGIHDRRSTVNRINDAIVSAGRRKERAALLFIDVNNFKQVNDTYGHAHGDRVLRHIAARMRAALRADEFIGRIGGDEFAVLLPTVSDVEEAGVLATRLTQAIAEEPLEDVLEPISLSIGIAIYPDHASEQAEWVNAADRAMYKAKRKNLTFALYEPIEGAAITVESIAERRYEREYLLCFQPIFDVASGRVWGAEALVRWLHPRNGLQSAGAAMTSAREKQTENSLDLWVVRSALSYATKWRALYGIERVHVNISARPHETIAHLLHAGGGAGTDSAALAFEIDVEALRHESDLRPWLQTLEGTGASLGLDGFGSGNIDLAMLQSLPIRFVKLSGDLLPSVAGGTSRAIEGVTALSKVFGWDVIATRIASAEDRRAIASAGVTHMQGFAFAQPMTAIDFEAWMQSDDGTAAKSVR